MATYKVELRNDNHYVMGLQWEVEDGQFEDNSMLVYHYPGGDCDTRMQNADMMLSALYGEYQCNERLKEGDRFETEFGNFVCVGVHVVPEKTNV